MLVQFGEDDGERDAGRGLWGKWMRGGDCEENGCGERTVRKRDAGRGTVRKMDAGRDCEENGCGEGTVRKRDTGRGL